MCKGYAMKKLLGEKQRSQENNSSESFKSNKKISNYNYVLNTTISHFWFKIGGE